MPKPSHWRIVPLRKSIDEPPSTVICGLCEHMDSHRPWCSYHRFKTDSLCIHRGQCKDWRLANRVKSAVQNTAMERHLALNANDARVIIAGTPMKPLL